MLTNTHTTTLRHNAYPLSYHTDLNEIKKSSILSFHALKYIRQKFYMCTDMTNAGMQTETDRTKLRHNACSRSHNASLHATHQGAKEKIS